MLGDRWQVEELLPVLQAFLERGEIDEPVDDEVIGVKYYTIAEACEAAYQYDPTAYPYRTPEEQDRLRRRLQRNIQRGNLWGNQERSTRTLQDSRHRFSRMASKEGD
jgi:hypothetical protein